MRSLQGILWLTLIFLSGSCLRLDDNLYNLSDKISQYKFDDYTGEQDFVLDDSYKIQDSMRHLFTLDSRDNDGKTFQIYALYLGDLARIKTDTVILYCHGNKWHMDFYWQRAKLMAHTGGKHRYGVLMLDYRGYGLSDDPTSEEGLYTDVNTCLEWLRLQGLSNDRLVIYGFSMGSAPATKLTSEPRSMVPSRLILEAPFGSADVMAADAAGLNMPGSFVTSLKINNADLIKKVTQPFFWMHGIGDNFLSIQTHGEVVFKNYGGTKRKAIRVPEADHGEVPEKMGFDTYLRELGQFISGK